MKYNLNNDWEIKKAQEYLQKLIEAKADAEIRKTPKKRTNPQNSYVHSMLGILAIDTGYTLEEMKIVVKRELGYYYEKNGQKFLQSTADLDTKTMGEFIDAMRNWASSTLGIYLLNPEEYNISMSDVDNYIERNNKGD